MPLPNLLLTTRIKTNIIKVHFTQLFSHFQELREAFHHLVTNVVVEFGKWLETTFPMGGRIGNIQTLKNATELNLSKEMHHRGINMRFLGVLYMCLTQGFWKKVRMDDEGVSLWKRVLNEMVYRVSKETLRVLMRNSMQRIGLATEEPYIRYDVYIPQKS